MATKTWEVNTLQRELSDGYVNKVIYRVNGSDGTYETRATGEVDLPKPETLIPYKDLTEEKVIGWVKAKLNSTTDTECKAIDVVANIEAAIDANITAQATPKHGTGTPWS